MLLGARNAKPGHLVDKGQPQNTFVLRSSMARAAVCGLDRLEAEARGSAPSSGLAIHVGGL